MSRSIPSAVLAVLALTLAAAPASAARLVTHDGTGDVYEKGDGEVYAEVGTRTNADVVGSALRHTDRRVHASVRYADLVAGDDRVITPVRVHASTGKTYVLRVSAGPGEREGTARLLRYTGTGARTVRVACPGLQHSVSYADDLVSVSVPRGCLGSPAWVRYGGTVRTVDASGAVFTDALLGGDAVDDLYSGRIRRG